jgi:exosortase family protein XrtF
VARQSAGLISALGYNAEIIAHESKAQMVLNINGRYLASIIEGCNSVSVIILFVAFILAFFQNFKKTFLFILCGSLFLYVVNVIRIAVLAIALYNFPSQEKFLHRVVFPGIIYGMVFLLWMLWIKLFVSKNETKYD